MNVKDYYRSGHKYLLYEGGKEEVRELLEEKLFSESEEEFDWAVLHIKSIIEGLPHIIYNTALPERLDVYRNLDRIKAFGLGILRDRFKLISERIPRLKEFESKRDALILLAKYLPEVASEPADFLYVVVPTLYLIEEAEVERIKSSEKEERLFKLCCRISLRYAVDEFVENSLLREELLRRLLENERDKRKYEPKKRYLEFLTKNMERGDLKLSIILFLLLNKDTQALLWIAFPEEARKKITNFLSKLDMKGIELSLINKFPYISENLMQELLNFISQTAANLMKEFSNFVPQDKRRFTSQISSSSFSFLFSDLLDIESKVIALKNRDMNFLNSALQVGSSTVSILSGSEKPSERK